MDSGSAITRVRRLRDSGLLDVSATEACDRITRLTQRLLGVEVALISLVDEEHQRFAGQAGVRSDLAEERGSPISHSYCRFAVATGERLVVPDARQSPLLRESPAITERDAVAYAGIPLRVGAYDDVVGTLCVIEPRPRVWTDADLETLTEMAEIARTELNSQVRDHRAGVVERLALRLPDPLARLGDSVRTTATLVERPDDPRLPRTADVARTRYQAVETLSDDLVRAVSAGHDRRTPRPDRLDLGERLAHAVRLATASARPGDLRLDLPPGPTTVVAVACDLDRALSLALVTALHHTAADGTVEVALRRDAGEAVLTVSAPGPAVPVAETLRVVGSFQSPGQDERPLDVSVRGATRVVRGERAVARTDRAGSRFEARLPLAPAVANQRS